METEPANCWSNGIELPHFTEGSYYKK